MAVGGGVDALDDPVNMSVTRFCTYPSSSSMANSVMVDLDKLQMSALWDNAGSALALTSSGDMTFRSGKLARWLQGHRTAWNRELGYRFVDCLRERYGAHVSDQVVQSTRLGAVLARGKPLRARHVTEACRQAQGFVLGVKAWNAALARCYTVPGPGGKENDALRVRIEREAQRAFPGNPTVAGLLDVAATARQVEAAFAAAGRDGTRLITHNHAADVLSQVISENLSAAFRGAAAGAARKFSLADPESIARRALASASGCLEPPLHLDVARLTADARDELNGRLQACIDDGTIPADRLGDEAALRAAAGRVVGDFVKERAAAATAVAGLTVIDVDDRGAMIDQVMHDIVPASMVPAVLSAGVVLTDDLAALGSPLKTRELQDRVAAVLNAMTQAFSCSETKIDGCNRDAMCRMFWRFLLARAEDGRVQALADTMRAPWSPLRAIGAAARWYADVFPGTDDEAQVRQSEPENATQLPSRDAQSARNAAAIAAMTSALVAVANERLDASRHVAPLAADDDVPDQTIATLRNLGVAMPAPHRIGEVNPRVPISVPGLRAIGQELESHLQSKGAARFEGGVLQESTRDHDRITYVIEGRKLPLDKGTVLREMRNFCSDGEYGLNEKLLKTLSMVAYRATTGCVLSTCLNPLRSDVAVFDGLPTLYPVVRYCNISSDDRGDVLVQCEHSGPVIRLDSIDRRGDPVLVETDPSASHVGVAVTIRIDARTAEVELKDVRISYSLMPQH